jgi:hypothetical protein
MLSTDIVLVNVQNRLGLEGFVMLVKDWSCW